MPLPLARGLIISLSILVAAGLAAYESPQVRAWFDESRRRIALALHSLGEEIQPPRDDLSMREDSSPEAEVHRQRARADILQRAQILRERQSQLNALEREMRSGSGRPRRRHTTSFDDFVDLEGKLKREEEEQAASSALAAGLSSAARQRPGAPSARKRKANDSFGVKIHEAPSTDADTSRLEIAATVLPVPGSSKASASCVKSDARRSWSTSSSHAGQLTPVTSRAPSVFNHGERNEAPSAPIEMMLQGQTSRPQSPPAPRSPQPLTSFRSVHEWAENSIASLYSHAQSSGGALPVIEFENGRLSSVASVIGSNEAMSEAEVLSDVGSAMRTPDTWTEIGSVMSEE